MKMRFFIFLLAFITLFPLFSFAKFLEGKIGNEFVVVDSTAFQQEDGTIQLTYRYITGTKSDKLYTLKGKINPQNNQVVLYEYDENNKNTGIFVGKYIKRTNSIKLTYWYTPSKKIRLKVLLPPINLAKVKIQVLYSLPKEFYEKYSFNYSFENDIVFSGDLERVAIRFNGTGYKEVLIVDGRPIEFPDSKKWAQFKCFLFSPNSKHFAYVLNKDNKLLLFVDDNLMGEYDYAAPYLEGLPFACPIFSPNSRYIAFVGEVDNFLYLLVTIFDVENKKKYEIGKYDRIYNLTFSPDGKHFAFEAEDGDKHFIVVDGKEIRKYYHSREPLFSPDGNRFAFIAAEENETGYKEFVVIDGQEGKRYDRISELSFSPDSRDFGYLAIKDKKVVLVINNKEIAEFKYIYYLIFAPDSQHFAYVASEGNKYFIVRNNTSKSKNHYELIGGLTFSPDSKKLVYIGMKDCQENPFEGTVCKKEIVVLNDKEIKQYEKVKGFTFSPDSKRLAYVAEKNNIRYVVIDGQEIPARAENLTFSPNSKHFAYKINESQEIKYNNVTEPFWYMSIMINNKELGPFNYVTPPLFTPDSKYLMFGAVKGREVWKVVYPLE